MGALHGAGMGRLIAVLRSCRQMEQQKEAGAAQSCNLRAQLDKYDSAYGACLTSRGAEAAPYEFLVITDIKASATSERVQKRA
jgi:hypothetical protein